MQHVTMLLPSAFTADCEFVMTSVSSTTCSPMPGVRIMDAIFMHAGQQDAAVEQKSCASGTNQCTKRMPVRWRSRTGRPLNHILLAGRLLRQLASCKVACWHLRPAYSA